MDPPTGQSGSTPSWLYTRPPIEPVEHHCIDPLDDHQLPRLDRPGTDVTKDVKAFILKKTKLTDEELMLILYVSRHELETIQDWMAKELNDQGIIDKFAAITARHKNTTKCRELMAPVVFDAQHKFRSLRPNEQRCDCGLGAGCEHKPGLTLLRKLLDHSLVINAIERAGKFKTGIQTMSPRKQTQRQERN